MAKTAAPRSVSDATRFTPTTPHASSKPTSPNSSRLSTPTSPTGRRPIQKSAGPVGETPEQRVARLRAAHLAAKNAEVSKFDKVISNGRRLFDSAHKITVMGLLGFTAIAGLATIYTTYDMWSYNRIRRAEFFERQRELEETSLEAARLAFMRGEATPEQIELIEYENERQGPGHRGQIFKAPSVLGAPKPYQAHPEASATESVSQAARWPAESQGSEEAAPEEEKKGWGSWLFSGLKKEQDTITGPDSSFKDKAKAAFDQERENQRQGGPLDRLGTEAEKPEEPPKKKGWNPLSGVF